MKRKTEQLHFRLTPEEKIKAKTAAEDEGVTLSEWLRTQIRVGYLQHELNHEQHTDSDGHHAD